MATGEIQLEWQSALARHFGYDLDVLLQPYDAEVVYARELTRIVSRRQRKAVQLADGRLLKARRFKTPQQVVLATFLMHGDFCIENMPVDSAGAQDGFWASPSRQ